VADRSAFGVAAAVVGVVVALDQLTKTIVVAKLGPDAPVARYDVLGSWFQLEYAENRGAAFGVLSGLGPLLALLSVVVVLVILFQFGREAKTERWRVVALGLVVGGAMGNVLDRIRLGYVVDFIAVGPWPNFNVADSAICVGVIALLWGWARPQLTPAPERI
jgi:signal peptidase II